MGYDKNHEWQGATLVLDPGVFTYDEPHVYMGQDPPGYATATSCMYRKDLQDQYCRAPARLLSFDHANAPAVVTDKCDTISVGSAYCCPQYSMPRNWRVDFLPLGQEEDAMEDQSLFSDAEIYAADARLVAGKLQMEAQPVLEEFTADAQEVYIELSKEFATTASNVSQQVAVVAQQATPIVTETTEDMRAKIRKHPLLALGFGIAAGAMVARWVSRRR
jgi:hypothetical protein